MTNEQTIPLSKLEPSPTNPRKIRHADKDQELQDNIQKYGILQSLLVRPVPGGAIAAQDPRKADQTRYEVVLGSRRHAAAERLKLAVVPAVIRFLTDDEVEEVQLVENLQRADMHPLDEADGFKRLTARGMTVASIATKIGCDRQKVRERLQLCALCKEGRDALLKGELDAYGALLIARIPHDDQQKRAVKRLTTKEEWSDKPPEGGFAARIIHREFMLHLDVAPFDRSDPQLVPAAGACTTCPKRTGNQAELFADVDTPDLCTDSKCHESKTKAHAEQLKATAKERGWETLAKKDAKALYPHGEALSYNAPYVELDSVCADDSKHRTYRKLLGDDVARTVAFKPSGAIAELLPRKGLTKLLKDAGHNFVQNRSSGSTKASAAAPKAKKKGIDEHELRERAAYSAVGEVVARIERRKATLALWRSLAEAAVVQGSDFDSELFKRRGWRDGGAATQVEHGLKAVRGMSEGELRGVVFEALLPPTIYFGTGDKHLRELCKEYGVNLESVTAKQRDAMKKELADAQAKKAKAKAEAKPKKKATKAKSKTAKKKVRGKK